MIVPLVWAAVVLVGLVLAYLTAHKALDQRGFELKVADDIRKVLNMRVESLEQRKVTPDDLARLKKELEERVLVVEQRTDPGLARGQTHRR